MKKWKLMYFILLSAFVVECFDLMFMHQELADVESSISTLEQGMIPDAD